MVDLSQLPPEVLNTFAVLPPPPGVISNFAHPAENRIGTRLAIFITLPMAVISMFMRIYTRARISGGVGADDLFAIASVACVCAYCGLILWMMDDLLGLHAWDINIGRLNEPYLKGIIASLGLYSLDAILVKLTLLLLYLRIFNPRNSARVLIWGAIVFIPLFYIATVGALVKFYVPPKGDGWISLRPASTTNALNNIVAVQSIVGIVSDFYILFIPIWFVSGLQLPLGRKIGVSAIFLSGLLACSCAIAGCIYRFKARKSLDSFWDTMLPYALSIVELNVAILCSCMPILFVVFKSAFTGDSLFTRLLYYTGRRSRSSTREEGKPSSSQSKGQMNDPSRHRLPGVPRPVMTGMRSFIWKGSRSKRTQEDSEVSSYHELTSVNDEYHRQLRDGNVS